MGSNHPKRKRCLPWGVRKDCAEDGALERHSSWHVTMKAPGENLDQRHWEGRGRRVGPLAKFRVGEVDTPSVSPPATSPGKDKEADGQGP